MEACIPCLGVRKGRVPPPPVAGDPLNRNVPAAARTFSFEELSAATRNFRDENLVAGSEPCVYRGRLKSVNQVVAVKLQHLVDRNNNVSTEQRNSEFLARVVMLNDLRHPKLVNLIGFCADGNHRILVHEYVPLGSLEDRLHDPSPEKPRLDWSTRMNIAAGVARGLQYLHDKGVVYRCLRSSDVLLGDGEGYHPKLSQYELAKAGRLFDDSEAQEAREFQIRTIGALAPETTMAAQVSMASDVYCFGVVLLELITGRRAFSPRAAEEEPLLVTWAQPLLKHRAGMRRMADPALQGRYPSKDLEMALAVAFICVQQEPAMRLPIGDLVKVMSLLAYDNGTEEPRGHLS
ncbi:serine/threonine-protein kinase PBL27 [Lolium perenne]|uniref:serine/threonine-protein kinase PBL27 n=1 Tax=Lolium perenne TaxID=4522 RepID=UPI0021EA411A|nr:serine/threonine-protein kinase PBL27-like [Lolium perenne]